MVYVRWRDASHDMDERRIDEMGLVELEEVGWLVAETPEHITLTMERIAGEDAPETARLWLTIPVVNLVEMLPLSVRRKRARAGAVEAEAAPPEAAI